MKLGDRLQRSRSTLAALVVAALAVDCGRDSAQGPEASQEFSRRLRLGVDQMRRFLPDSAEAELEKCAEIRPDDPDLLFQKARLLLFARPGRAADPAAAIALLEKTLQASPRSVRAHRLLAELKGLAGDRRAASSHRSAVSEIYGPIGQLEMDRYLASEDPPGSPPREMPQPKPGTPGHSDFQDFIRANRLILREGQYAPTAGVPVLEKLMAKYPDLAAVRKHYGWWLVIGEVRVNFTDRPDLPPMSSKLVLDYARAHLEQAFDQVNPGSPFARELTDNRATVALQVGDWDDAVALLDVLLDDPGLAGPARRELNARKGLVRFKQDRFDEAVRLLAESLEGDPGPVVARLPRLWLLHLAQEKAGIEPSRRRPSFSFRKDLALRGAATPIRFEDIASRLRVDRLNGLGASAWGDYDGDGDFDLFLTGHETYGVLLRNDGEGFTDVSREAGLGAVQAGFTTTFVDYDNDGRPDLYVSRDGWSGPAPNSLYHNRGDGSFEDATEAAGLGDPGDSFVHIWSDVDRDGFVDLYVCNGITITGATNRLFHNQGDGTFTDVTARAGLAEPAGTQTIAATFGDYDLDGWPDLFVSGFRAKNRLYRNRGDGTFEEVAKRAGVDGADAIGAGYVSFLLDVDNDGWPDLLKTTLAPWEDTLLALSDAFDSVPPQGREWMNRSTPKLYRNRRDGTFTDVTVRAGLVHPMGVMGSIAGDFDNDGYVDLYFGTGDPRIERMEPDRFYRNNGDGTFTDLTFAADLGNVGKGHGSTTVDWDGDGDLDLYAQEGGFVHGDQWRNAFYKNQQATGNHWLHVDLEGTKSNRGAIDARLTLKAGKLVVLREVKNGEGFGCSNSPTVEFGLGREESVDELEVAWPSGLVQTFKNLPVDRRLYLREGQELAAWSERK